MGSAFSKIGSSPATQTKFLPLNTSHPVQKESLRQRIGNFFFRKPQFDNQTLKNYQEPSSQGYRFCRSIQKNKEINSPQISNDSLNILSILQKEKNLSPPIK